MEHIRDNHFESSLLEEISYFGSQLREILLVASLRQIYVKVVLIQNLLGIDSLEPLFIPDQEPQQAEGLGQRSLSEQGSCPEIWLLGLLLS